MHCFSSLYYFVNTHNKSLKTKVTTRVAPADTSDTDSYGNNDFEASFVAKPSEDYNGWPSAVCRANC